jgi:hypothetical protein
MLQIVTPIFTEETALLDMAVRNGLAPAPTVVGWNESLAHDVWFLSQAGIARDARVLDISPHGLRVGVSLASHVRSGRYLALEWLDAWIGFSRDMIAFHGLQDVAELRHAQPPAILELGETWDAIVFWDLGFRGDGSHVMQLIEVCAGLLRPGGCIVFQYRAPAFLEQPRMVRRGLLGDIHAPEFGLQDANWTH